MAVTGRGVAARIENHISVVKLCRSQGEHEAKGGEGGEGGEDEGLRVRGP